ncbi:MAG: hypothetical protein JSS75_07275 [Bacteroidetes bacterium]|nr:hypothetical protein [Bacteroidota bacterium]
MPNLLITRLSDGATFTDAQDSLRKLWEDHYKIWHTPFESEIPDEYQADEFSVQFQDGTISVVGWYDDQPCEPIELRPGKYEVTLTAHSTSDTRKEGEV